MVNQLDNYNVVWRSPSQRPRDSMPTGNGKIGLNVWVEQNGDLVLWGYALDSGAPHM